MAFAHGSAAKFRVDDSGGTLRDLSAYVNSVEGLPGDGEVAGTTTYGTPVVNKTFIRGLAGATFTIGGNYDPTATTGPDVVLSGIRTSSSSASFEYEPGGSGTGQVRYSGECFLTNYALSSPVGDVVSFSADFTVTGAVTRTVL